MNSEPDQIPPARSPYEVWWYAAAMYNQLCGTREQAKTREEYLRLTELCWEALQARREAWLAYEAAETR